MNRPRLLVLTSIAMLTMSAISGFIAVQTQQAPSEKGDFEGDLQQNAGIVRQGEKLQLTFPLRNVTSKPISLLAMHPDCSCTKAKASSKVVNAGEVLSVIVEISVGASRKHLSEGLAVIYRVADSDARSMSLRVMADVEHDFEYDGSDLVFSGTSPSERTIDFHSGRLESFRIQEAHTTSDIFEAKVEEVHDNSGLARFRIIVRCEPSLLESRDMRAKTFNAHLVVRTNSPNEKTCRIGLKWLR